MQCLRLVGFRVVGCPFVHGAVYQVDTAVRRAARQDTAVGQCAAYGAPAQGGRGAGHRCGKGKLSCCALALLLLLHLSAGCYCTHMLLAYPSAATYVALAGAVL